MAMAGNGNEKDCVSIKYHGNNFMVDRMRIEETFVRKFFKSFPRNRSVIISCCESSESVPIEDFYAWSIGKTAFRVVEGDLIGSAVERTNDAGNFRPSREDSHAFNPRKPFIESRDRSPINMSSGRKSTITGNKKAYVAIEPGIQVSARSVKPLEQRQLKHVSIFRNGFTFDHLVELVFEAFEIQIADRKNYRLKNSMAQILSSDDKTNDFGWWEKRPKNSTLFLVCDKEDRSDDSEDSDTETMRSTRSKNKPPHGFGSSGATANENVNLGYRGNIPVFNLDDDDGSTYEPDYPPLVASPHLLDQPVENPVVESVPVVVETKATAAKGYTCGRTLECNGFEDTIRLLECSICYNTSAKPQKCPKNMHVMGGEKCIEEHFKSQEAADKPKTCPKCRAEVDTYNNTDEEYQKMENGLRAMRSACEKFSFITFCPK